MTRRPRGIPRLGRVLERLLSQETARTNAAGASAQLQRRRHEREEVEAYLRAVHSSIAAGIR